MSMSSTPRGEHAGRPGTTWSTRLEWYGEELVDDSPWDPDPAPAPRANRATRRAAARTNRNRRTR